MGKKKKETPEEFLKLLEQMRSGGPDLPTPEITKEEEERISAQLRDALTETKAKIATIKARGGPGVQMDAVTALMQGMADAFGKLDLSPDVIDSKIGLEQTPMLERNGRAVVIDILDEATLKEGPVELLVDRFADLATAHHHAEANGRITRANRLFGRIRTIVEALRTRTPDARSALLPLLDDSNPAVRRSAAFACRDIAPDKAARASET